jgi:type II restriction enzyme
MVDKLIPFDNTTKIEQLSNLNIVSFHKRTTLFNPGKGTNFIYKVNPADALDIAKFNNETYQGRYKLVKRLRALNEQGLNIEFLGIESDNLFRNLFLIDSDLPRIVAEFLVQRYIENKSNLYELTNIIEDKNPLSYPVDLERSYYTYKIKKMLRDMSMGMTAETPWNGKFDASGGTLVVRDDGEVVCYHVYDIQKFESYLIKNTYLETPSTGEDKNKPGSPKPKDKGKNYNFGWLYKKNGEICLKLNLQIRYTG